jgi:hypothetical protein
MHRKAFIVLLLVFAPVVVFSQRLEKGFEALRIYNYFRAQELFLKAEKRHPAGAHFGLASIYSNDKNPFYNITRAHQQILSARWAFATSSVKEKTRLQKLGVNDSVIVQLEKRIDTLGYHEAERKNSVAAYNIYIEEFCGSSLVWRAVKNRNALAYAEAEQANSYEAFRDFIVSYPEAEQVPAAQAAYDRRLFETKTADSLLTSYVNFINEFPESPYRATAEDVVYKMSVPGYSIAEYHAFIKAYPGNRNVPDAWKSLYALYTADGSSTTIAQFWLTYPEFPFRETISEDLRLSMTTFYPVRENGKWGFADSTGKILIGCQYEWVEPFSEGVAAAGLNDKCGYINKNGSVAIAFQFEEGEQFQRGLAQVISNGKTGICDKAGNFVVKPVYDGISEFRQTRARVVRGDKQGFIDMMGNEVVACKYEAVGDFSEGLAYVKDSSKYGYIDREGRIVIAPQYEWAEPFDQGSARVKKDGMYGLISFDGKILIPCEYNYIGTFSEGMALVVKGTMCGYVNRDGRVVVEPKYDYDRTMLGESPFVNGRAKVLLKDKFGMIDTTGKIIVPREYEDLGAMRDGLFPAKKKDKWGFIDEKMKLKVPYLYEYAWSFSDGLARVRKDGLLGYIDTKGKEIVAPRYEEATDCMNGFMKVKTDTGWGLLNASGNQVVPCKYDKIEFVSPVELRVERNEKFGYYHLLKNTFIWKESGLE